MRTGSCSPATRARQPHASCCTYYKQCRSGVSIPSVSPVTVVAARQLMTHCGPGPRLQAGALVHHNLLYERRVFRLDNSSSRLSLAPTSYPCVPLSCEQKLWLSSMPFSPRQQFAGQSVLLTGGLGYLGSVVLEQLLRLTEVSKCYLLVRGKRRHTAAKRVEDLLCGPLFHLLHKEAAEGRSNVFQKVIAIEGDLTKPQLGLSSDDLHVLQQDIGIILHCGANIELEADVQATLRNNYLGTLELLQVASQFSSLKSFVHVSTYFVNNNLPRNSLVKEQIYDLPLSLNGVSMTHGDYVTAMLAMDADSANKHTLALMQSLNFTSTYAFGKHLTEQLVNSTCIRPGVHRAIVRPSLIASVAFEPYPGYINSYAGAGGYTMGYGLGFFQGLRSVAYASDTILDLIPADVVAALVIAAGAAAAATAGSSKRDYGAAIFHAASAESNPLPIGHCFDKMGQFWRANPPPLCLPATRYVSMTGQHDPTQQGIDRGAAAAQIKIKLVGALLKLAGKHKEYKALKMGFKAFSVHNSLAYDKSLICSVANGRAALAQILVDERKQWPLVWEKSEAMNCDCYEHTFMAGVRRLLFRIEKPSGKVGHNFKYKAGIDAETLRMWSSSSLQASQSTDTSSSSNSSSGSCSCSSNDDLAAAAKIVAATVVAKQLAVEQVAADEEQQQDMLKAVTITPVA